jgi:hypothetical protein
METIASARTCGFKWIPQTGAALLMMLALPACRLVYDEDISEDARFRAFYGKCFELKEDAFLWRWPDTHEPQLTVPNKSYGDYLPLTVEEYRRNPDTGSHSPEYNERVSSRSPGLVIADEPRGDVVAVVAKGDRFVVSKVLMNHHIEVGNTLHVKARLQTTVAGASAALRIDGVDEFEVDQLIDGNSSQDALQYHGALVMPCKQADSQLSP